MTIDIRTFGRQGNFFGQLKSLFEARIGPFVNAGAPTDGTSGTLANYAGPGAVLIDTTNGVTYLNTGTLASPVWTKTSGKSVLNQISGTIVSADVTSTAAGKFGHADGYPVVPAGGAGTILELVSAEIFYDFLTAAYTAGGNITVNYAAGAALTGLVSAANSVGAAGDKPVIFYPLSTAGVPALVNTGINLVSSAAFTNPGTAAGVIRYVVTYRTHLTGF